MNWMILPLKRYADFQGRSRRLEYWMFSLGIFIVYMLFFVLVGGLGALFGGDKEASNIGSLVIVVPAVLVLLALIVPSIAVQVRRLHDQDKSGWFILLSFIPYVGGLIVLVLMCLPGTKGPNRFGDDPLDEGGVEAVKGVFD